MSEDLIPYTLNEFEKLDVHTQANVLLKYLSEQIQATGISLNSHQFNASQVLNSLIGIRYKIQLVNATLLSILAAGREGVFIDPQQMINATFELHCGLVKLNPLLIQTEGKLLNYKDEFNLAAKKLSDTFQKFNAMVVEAVGVLEKQSDKAKNESQTSNNHVEVAEVIQSAQNQIINVLNEKLQQLQIEHSMNPQIIKTPVQDPVLLAENERLLVERDTLKTIVTNQCSKLNENYVIKNKMEEKLRAEISTLRAQVEQLEREKKHLKRKLDEEIETSNSAITKLAGPKMRKQMKELKRGRPKGPRPESKKSNSASTSGLTIRLQDCTKVQRSSVSVQVTSSVSSSSDEAERPRQLGRRTPRITDPMRRRPPPVVVSEIMSASDTIEDDEIVIVEEEVVEEVCSIPLPLGSPPPRDNLETVDMDYELLSESEISTIPSGFQSDLEQCETILDLPNLNPKFKFFFQRNQADPTTIFFVYRRFDGRIIKRECNKLSVRKFGTFEYELLRIPDLPFSILHQFVTPFMSVCLKLGEQFRDNNRCSAVSIDITTYHSFVASAYLKSQYIPSEDNAVKAVFRPNWGMYARVASRKCAKLDIYNQTGTILFDFPCYIIDCDQAPGFQSTNLVLGSEFLHLYWKSVLPNSDGTTADKLSLVSSSSEYWWTTWQPKRLTGDVPIRHHYLDHGDVEDEFA